MITLNLLPNDYVSDIQEIELIEDPPFLFAATIYEAKFKYPIVAPHVRTFGVTIVGTEFMWTDAEDIFDMVFTCVLVLDVV